MNKPHTIIAATIFDYRHQKPTVLSSDKFADLIIHALEIRGFQVMAVEESDQET